MLVLISFRHENLRAARATVLFRLIVSTRTIPSREARAARAGPIVSTLTHHTVRDTLCSGFSRVPPVPPGRGRAQLGTFLRTGSSNISCRLVLYRYTTSMRNAQRDTFSTRPIPPAGRWRATKFTLQALPGGGTRGMWRACPRAAHF